MKTLNEEAARTKICPLSLAQSSGPARQCIASNCMWWVEIHSEVTREDHSDGHHYMLSLKVQQSRSSSLEREGPPGCSGVWILPAEGICAIAALHQPPIYQLKTLETGSFKHD